MHTLNSPYSPIYISAKNIQQNILPNQSIKPGENIKPSQSVRRSDSQSVRRSDSQSIRPSQSVRRSDSQSVTRSESIRRGQSYIFKEGNKCNKILLWGQYAPNCWLNALFTTLFRSQRSVQLLKSTLKNEGTMFQKLAFNIVNYKFIASKQRENDKKFFERIKAQNIYKILHNEDKNYFVDIDSGKYGTNDGKSIFLISKLYELLGLKCLILDVGNNKFVYYSNKNNITKIKLNENNRSICEYDENIENITRNTNNKLSNPDVLILYNNTLDINDKIMFKDNQFIENPEILLFNESLNTEYSIPHFKDTINYNYNLYELDSVILSNYNIKEKRTKIGHVIAGITCNNNKYVYNGWFKQTYDNNIDSDYELSDEPCPLIPLEWDVTKENKFCLNSKECTLPTVDEESIKERNCFDFSKGQRIMIYIKKADTSYMQNFNTPEYNPLNSFLNNSYIKQILNENIKSIEITKTELINIQKCINNIYNLIKEIYDYKHVILRIFWKKKSLSYDIKEKLTKYLNSDDEYDLNKHVMNFKIIYGGGNKQENTKLKDDIINTLQLYDIEIKNHFEKFNLFKNENQLNTSFNNLLKKIKDDKVFLQIKDIGYLSVLLPIIEKLKEQIIYIIDNCIKTDNENITTSKLIILPKYLEMFNEISKVFLDLAKNKYNI
jgi:hypothetical protein